MLFLFFLVLVILLLQHLVAYNNPPVEDGPDGDLRLSGRIITHTKNKMRAIFNMALDNGT